MLIISGILPTLLQNGVGNLDKVYQLTTYITPVIAKYVRGLGYLFFQNTVASNYRTLLDLGTFSLLSLLFHVNNQKTVGNEKDPAMYKKGGLMCDPDKEVGFKA